MGLQGDIVLEGFDEQIKLLDGFEAIAKKELEGSMYQAVWMIAGEARKNAPVNIGTLRSSIVGKTKTGSGFVEGSVGSHVPYAAAVEFGQRPHMPPLRPIAFWVNRKLGIGGWEGIAVAIRVARKIMRSGVAAKPYLIPAFEKSEGQLMGLLREGIERIVKRLAGK